MLLLEKIEPFMRAAGAAILCHYGESIAVQLKDDNSPVTQADRDSHQILFRGLTDCFPDIPVLSEEGDLTEDRSGWKRYFSIDPLDGTKGFIARNGEFTVNVALLENTFPVFSCIYVPVSETLYYAEQGKGALVSTKGANFQPLPFNAADRASILISRHDPKAVELAALFDGFQVVTMESSLKLCKIAEGSAAIYIRTIGSMEWDIASGACLVELSGGRVVDFNGDRISYSQRDLRNPPFIALSSAYSHESEKWCRKINEFNAARR